MRRKQEAGPGRSSSGPASSPLFTGMRGKRNSRKCAGASDSSTQRQSLGNRPWCSPPALKRGDLVAVVAPFCIKGLRLVTMQLPEKFSPIGVGTNRTSHIRVSRKFAPTDDYEELPFFPSSARPSLPLIKSSYFWPLGIVTPSSDKVSLSNLLTPAPPRTASLRSTLLRSALVRSVPHSLAPL